MIRALFEVIPAPEVMEYHGEVPTAFIDLTAFSPLAEMRGSPPEAARPVPSAPSVAHWMHPGSTPAATEPDLPQLERFKALMAENHWPVHVARMLFDRQYAYGRLLLAHASCNYELRLLALGLFKVFQSRGQSH